MRSFLFTTTAWLLCILVACSTPRTVNEQSVVVTPEIHDTSDDVSHEYIVYFSKDHSPKDLEDMLESSSLFGRQLSRSSNAWMLDLKSANPDERQRILDLLEASTIVTKTVENFNFEPR